LSNVTVSVLFIHSSGPQSESEGSGRLVAALRSGLPEDYRLSAPSMPVPDDPEAAAWDKAVSKHISAAAAPLVLVGHSLGASAILKYLDEHKSPPGLRAVILIATPFWGENMKPWMLPRGFAKRLAAVPRLIFYQSKDDEEVPFSHLERYAAAMPHALVRKVDGRGHLFDNGDVADILADITTV
jgi:predicted alpha/beta hydrolase family esterase